MLRSIVGSALALTLVVGVAEAQMIGLKGGMNIASVSGDVPDAFESRTAFGFGGFVVLPRSSNLAIQIEALYMGKGAEGEEDDVNLELQINYIEVPVLIRYSFGGEHGGVSPHIFGGAAPAFKASCNVKGSEMGVSLSASCEDVGLDVNSFDLGLVAGAGVAIPLGGATLTLDARATFGLLNVDGSDGDDTARNRAYSFMAGVAIPLRR